MRPFVLLTATVLACAPGAEHGAGGQATPPDSAKKVQVSAGQVDSTPPAPQPVRALYVNRWASQSWKILHRLIGIADSTEINAFVIDMKDEFGLNFRTANAEWAKVAGTANKVSKLQPLLDTLKAHHILPIARMVVFKDSVTARVHPTWTIRTKDSTAWHDREGLTWVNPYHKELWEYNIGIAEELVKAGFAEIQFDYIRFPEPYASLPQQVFPESNGVPKPAALAAYLAMAKARLNKLGAKSTADIFGLVTTVPGALEVGQEWEKVSPNVDVVLPMVYPSHYPKGSFNLERPNAEPYKVISLAIAKAKERDEKLGIKSTDHVRPWLQAFTLGKMKPEYGPEQIEAQKKAVYDAGYTGWVLWNPASRYDVFRPALTRDSTTAAAAPTPPK